MVVLRKTSERAESKDQQDEEEEQTHFMTLEDHHETSTSAGDRWYFSYGPLVHPMCRERRNVNTTADPHQAAVLLDHRLVFSHAIVNAMPKRGWNVHGVVMRVSNDADWQKIVSVDSGAMSQVLMDVYPYQKQKPQHYKEETEDQDDLLAAIENTEPIDSTTTNLEQKPQERYLRLIAEGMRLYGVDETYVNNEIMSCTYIPKRAPEDWYTFPASKDLPKRTMKQYEKVCKKAANNKSDGVYFVVHDFVMKLEQPYNPQNPAVTWLREHCHGKPDICFQAHQIVVDPDIPWAKTPEEMTLLHYAWAEDDLVEFFQLSGLTAQKVYRLVDNEENGGGGMMKRIRNSFRSSMNSSTAASSRSSVSSRTERSSSMKISSGSSGKPV